MIVYIQTPLIWTSNWEVMRIVNMHVMKVGDEYKIVDKDDVNA